MLCSSQEPNTCNYLIAISLCLKGPKNRPVDHDGCLKIAVSNAEVQVYISQALPAFRKQHAAAVGRSALVVHFAYYTQEEGLLHNTSDLLSEYKRFAS